MLTARVRIEGISPLLVNRFKETPSEPKKKVKRGEEREEKSPREQAEETAYQDKDGKLWIPGTWISGAIKTVASDYKFKSTRKTLKSVTGGAIIPGEAKIYFLEEYDISDIEVDSQPVCIPHAPGRPRIMRHRTRLDSWSIEFTLEIDDEIVDDKQVYDLLSDAGRRAGIGDYRPAKGGPFGRYQIRQWEILGEDGKPQKPKTQKNAAKARKQDVEEDVVEAPKKRGRPRKT